MKLTRTIFVVLSIVIVPAMMLGQIPRTLSYQGVLSDTLGNPKPDGTYSFTFRLYETSSGGGAMWTEQKSLQLKRGLFHTALGDQVVIGNAIGFDKPYWLGIQVAPDPEMIPRVALSSVGYSRRAEKADTATYALGAPSQTFVDSARVAGTIPDGVVTTGKIGNNAVTSGKIASAQVVKSINSLKDDVTLSAGSNVTITPSGNTLTIAASGGGGGGNVNGTGATSQVPFWTGTSSISGDNGLVWDNTNKRLGLGVSSPLDALQVNATTGNAVFGNSLSTTGTSAGVYGVSASGTGKGVRGLGYTGVLGEASPLTGVAVGVIGRSSSSAGTGVYGEASALTGFTEGVSGFSASSNGKAVYGIVPATSGTTYGIDGVSASSSGTGVRGQATSTTGTTHGVFGSVSSPDGAGIWGSNTSTGANATAVYGEIPSTAPGGFSAAVKGVNFGTSGNGIGVWGEQNGSGWGVYGSAITGIGVSGNASSTTGLNYGVYGASSSSSGNGVRGVASATTGSADGVVGISSSPSGHGVQGQSPLVGVYGVATSTVFDSYGVKGYSPSCGVYGQATSTTGLNNGVYGESNSGGGHGVSGYATSTTGSNYGVYGWTSSTAGIGVFGTAPAGGYAMFSSGSFRMFTGTFNATPTSTIWTTNKPATVKLADGAKVKLFAEEAAEIYFNDYGEGRLVNGRAHIDLDPKFGQTVTIDASHPMKVFVQPEDDCKGVFVSNKTSSGFDVVELQRGKSDATFSYRIVCKRKYYEDERLATEEEDIRFNARMHEQAWPEVIAEQQSEQQRMKEREQQNQQRRQAEEQQRINRDRR